MAKKTCCYRNRPCHPSCVAYSNAHEIRDGAEKLGLTEMNCVRLLVDLKDLVKIVYTDSDDD